MLKWLNPSGVRFGCGLVWVHSNPEEEALLIGDVSTYSPLKNVGRFRVADDESIYPLTVALLGCVASRLVIG